MMESYAASPKDGGGGGAEGGRADAATGLEESMWRLGLAGGEEAAGEGLPERPGEANCVYYLRTGACGYGETCRYNHPRDRAAAVSWAASLLPILFLPSCSASLQSSWDLLLTTRQSLIMTDRFNYSWSVRRGASSSSLLL